MLLWGKNWKCRAPGPGIESRVIFYAPSSLGRGWICCQLGRPAFAKDFRFVAFLQPRPVPESSCQQAYWQNIGQQNFGPRASLRQGAQVRNDLTSIILSLLPDIRGSNRPISRVAAERVTDDSAGTSKNPNPNRRTPAMRPACGSSASARRAANRPVAPTVAPTATDSCGTRR